MPKLAAQMHNLVSENRVPEISEVRDHVGIAFRSAPEQNIIFAEEAIREAQAPLRFPSCAFLGLIPFKETSHSTFLGITFLTGTQIERHIIPTFNGRASVMPSRVNLPTPLFARYPRRFLWTTFNEEIEGLTPTEIAVSLGLPHFSAGETVYRVPLGIWPKEVYVPTCMDSGIFEAWMRPPDSYGPRWGVTRNLLTGACDKPELLVQVADVERRGLIAERVGNPAEVVDVFVPDYLAGRDLSICA